jgi:hypothetical protein
VNNANLISLRSIILSKLKVCRDLRERRTGVHSGNRGVEISLEHMTK